MSKKKYYISKNLGKFVIESDTYWFKEHSIPNTTSRNVLFQDKSVLSATISNRSPSYFSIYIIDFSSLGINDKLKTEFQFNCNNTGETMNLFNTILADLTGSNTTNNSWSQLI
jgi:hypothetical protein